MHRHGAFPAQADELWVRLDEFEIDDPGCVDVFATRLMREQGWSRDFTSRVIDEYKRFLFLAGRAKHPVTPSKSVDEAWHLHMIFTRSYWQRLCKGVLHQPLHHEPAGGDDDAERFARQYQQTLQSYRAWFGEPPEDVWPGQVADGLGVEPMLTKRSSSGVIRHVVAAAIVTAGVVVAVKQDTWIEVIVVLTVAAVIAATLYRQSSGEASSSGCGSGCGGCGNDGGGDAGCGGGCGGD